MKLRNFEVSSSIELQSGDSFCDLHNSASFDALELRPKENLAVMRWSLPAASGAKLSGIELRFTGLQFLSAGLRDGELPLSEDTCVSYVLKVDPRVENDDPYLRQVFDLSDSFRLLFRFQSGRIIEVGSESVELIPVG